ncbi:hypothetical protein HJG60_008205 [Phyllostomus discolor]|uniref:Uncharacterized protein n=1 Tax=Phyllostomus discolor TaxID=89673 RepID=A0A833Z8Q4_9CHIR|nr:hypothetical protein HJG60_008205 [Phyllostomus discolor]
MLQRVVQGHGAHKSWNRRSWVCSQLGTEEPAWPHRTWWAREGTGCPFEGPGGLQKGAGMGSVRSAALLDATCRVGEEGLEVAHENGQCHPAIVHHPLYSASQSCKGSSRSPGLRPPCALHLSQLGPARDASQLDQPGLCPHWAELGGGGQKLQGQCEQEEVPGESSALTPQGGPQSPRIICTSHISLFWSWL